MYLRNRSYKIRMKQVDSVSNPLGQNNIHASLDSNQSGPDVPPDFNIETDVPVDKENQNLGHEFSENTA